MIIILIQPGNNFINKFLKTNLIYNNMIYYFSHKLKFLLVKIKKY